MWLRLPTDTTCRCILEGAVSSEGRKTRTTKLMDDDVEIQNFWNRRFEIFQMTN